MNTLWIAIVVGIVVGLLDIAPMVIQKLPRYSIVSEFLFFLFITLIIFHINVPYLPWWLEGSLVSLMMMLPILIHVGAFDKKPLPIIAVNTIILGGGDQPS